MTYLIGGLAVQLLMYLWFPQLMAFNLFFFILFTVKHVRFTDED